MEADNSERLGANHAYASEKTGPPGYPSSSKKIESEDLSDL